MLYLSFSTKRCDMYSNKRFVQVYFNDELIGSAARGGWNRVDDTIYWGTEVPLTKRLAHGDNITI